MKIFCIAQNYPLHNQEMDMNTPKNPIIFIKPETAYLRNYTEFYIPDFANQFDYEAEIIVKIGKMGKCIPKRLAASFIDQISIGLDMTARDLQKECIENGMPWTLCKGFDSSAPMGDFVDRENYNLNNLNFSLKLNGQIVQSANTNQMIFSIEEIVSYVSNYFTLKKGDVIFTGTPKGVGKVSIGDKLEGFVEDKKLLEITIK